MTHLAPRPITYEKIHWIVAYISTKLSKPLLGWNEKLLIFVAYILEIGSGFFFENVDLCFDFVKPVETEVRVCHFIL